MLKLKNRCIVVLKDEEEKSSNYRVPKELFLKFQEELAQYRSESAKPKAIRCIETGEVFRCARATYKWLEEKGVQVSYSFEASIKKACYKPNRTAYGCHWEFVE